MTTQRLGFWGQIKLPCDPKPPLLTAWTALWTPPESHSCWGPLFELTAGGLQHLLALRCPFSPALPQTLHTVTIDWRRLLRGLKPPTAATRLVNRSMQADHLRVPGVRSPESCSCVLLPAPFTGDHKGKRLWGPMRLNRKLKVIKLETFKVTHLLKDCLDCFI